MEILYGSGTDQSRTIQVFLNSPGTSFSSSPYT